MNREQNGRWWGPRGWVGWFVLAAWGCSAASMILVWFQSTWYVFHPHYVPLVLLFSGLAISSIIAAAGCAWRMILGPNRWRAARLFIAVIPPAGIWCYIGATANANWSVRSVPNTFAMRAAKVMGVTLMRLDAEFNYQKRLESDRIVMFYDPRRSPYPERVERPEEDLAEMDRHLAHFEQQLGDRIAAKVYWVRGPALGRTMLSVHGMCLGNAWSPEPSLESSHHFRGDRHELAHGALDWYRTPSSDPPYVLHEGWAVAQCGDTRLDLAQMAARAKTENPEVSVRDLFGADWYYRDDGLVYSYGGAFVEYLIRTYDAGRFRRFYTECSPDHVDAKCQEIFERSLETLEAEFWKDVDEAVGGPVDSQADLFHSRQPRPRSRSRGGPNWEPARLPS